jgi:hypothetical protein
MPSRSVCWTIWTRRRRACRASFSPSGSIRHPIRDAPPFAHPAAYFAQHPQNIAVSPVVAILAALHAPSDREAHRLLPALLR